MPSNTNQIPRNDRRTHLYLRGRYHWFSRRKEAMAKAAEYYEEAVEKDSSYALPHIGNVCHS